MNQAERFEKATVEQLKVGFVERKEFFHCLFCEHSIEKGIVYVKNDVFYEAEKFMKVHVEEQHTSAFDYLVNQNKKMTGLTDHQSLLLKAFYNQKDDKTIQEELEIRSASTIRQHRFALREKEKQAKIFLAMMNLLHEKDANPVDFVPIHATATMVDDRYQVTKSEAEDVLATLFPEGVEGKLVRFPKKQKHKIIVLRAITETLNCDEKYSEKQLNTHLENMYDDYVTLRRYLIEYGFVDRLDDGSEYWVKK